MTSIKSLGTIGSLCSFFVNNYVLSTTLIGTKNIVSTDQRYILQIQVLLECCYV